MTQSTIPIHHTASIVQSTIMGMITIHHTASMQTVCRPGLQLALLVYSNPGYPIVHQ
jgi:hypothetical protein